MAGSLCCWARRARESQRCCAASMAWLAPQTERCRWPICRAAARARTAATSGANSAASLASLWALGPTLPFMAATGAALGWNLVTTRRQWRHLAWDVRTVRAALPARVEVLVGRVIPRAEQVAEPARRALPVGRAA